jgi:hypothetical protein
MPAQAAMARHIAKHDAAALKVSFAGCAFDGDGLSPDAARCLEQFPLVVAVGVLRRWCDGRRLPASCLLAVGEDFDRFAHAHIVEELH